MASIKVITDGAEQTVALDAATVTLGRGLESDVRLKDIKASRRHCQILKSAAGYQCLDLSSGNGTFINGVQIKKQVLTTGDKIQIGATTIVFNDGGVAPRPAPKAAAPATAPPKTSPATTRGTPVKQSQIPVVATRKMTPPASKPPSRTGTGSVPRVGTSRVPKTGSQSIPRKTTGRIKKTGTGRGSTRATASQRFHAEASKKKTNPISVIIGIIGAIVVIALGWVFFGPKDDSEWVREQFKIMNGKASAAFDAGQHQAAIKHYDEILLMFDGREDFKITAAEVRKLKEQVEEYVAQIIEGEKKLEKLESRFNATSISASEMTELKADARALNGQFSAVEGGDWIPRLKILREKIQKSIDSSAKIDKMKDYQAMRQAIIDACKLDQGAGGAADWSDAIKRWNDYMALDGLSDNNKEKARGDIRRLHGRAKEDLRVIRIRVRNKIEEGARADAVQLIKDAMPRFELTEVAGELKALLEETDK